MSPQLMSKRWNIRNPNPQLQVELSNALGLHPIIVQLLINRQVTDIREAKSFLDAGLSHLHDPFLFKDMDRAVERIKKAKNDGEAVLIFGDYDVDGVTSSALLYNCLTKAGIKAFNYIPHRMSEGYGLNHGIAEYAVEKGVALIIAVDCGINAFSAVDAINQAGIDVIILDHHEPSEGQLPAAVAVINPKREDCPYPFKGLASVGLVAKLIQAFEGRFPEEYLDLIAIGTIADVAQLRGENRIFVKEGLPKIQKTRNIGLQALMDIAKISGKKFKPYYVGFILGPRINATGRMDSAHASLELLLADSKEQASELAQTLENHNTQRQKMQKDIVQEALDIVEREVNFNQQKVIVLYKEGWHKGVLGIVASRIVEKYYRPTIVLSIKDGIGIGSARSISGFHLFEALTHCAEHLENFGGHKMAAGLTVREEKIASFSQLINEFAANAMTVEDLLPTIELDGEVPLNQLSLKLAQIVDSLEPFGEGNPTPVFCSRNLSLKTAPVIHGKDTLKFWVTDGEVVVQAVGFGMGEKYFDLLKTTPKIDLAYNLSIDDWNKDPIVSLKLKDIRESGE